MSPNSYGYDGNVETRFTKLVPVRMPHNMADQLLAAARAANVTSTAIVLRALDLYLTTQEWIPQKYVNVRYGYSYRSKLQRLEEGGREK